MSAVVSAGRQPDPLVGDGAAQRHLLAGLLQRGVGGGRWRSPAFTRSAEAGEVPLDLGDAMLQGEQPLAEEPLEDRADRRPVNQLEDEQVGLNKI